MICAVKTLDVHVYRIEKSERNNENKNYMERLLMKILNEIKSV